MNFHIDVETSTQPENWLTAAEIAPQFAQYLPQAGERVALVGCGTSWFMSMAFASIRESMRLGESDAYTASEFNYGRRYDRVIALTRTGTTTETVDVLRQLAGRVPTTVITSLPDSPAEEAADHAIVIDFAPEESVVSTRFATTTLALLRAHLGQNLSAASEQARDLLEVPLDQLVNTEQISFLGSGWSLAMAHEAALKLRETAQFWSESHPAMDYRHGPISIAQAGRVTWCFGEVPAKLKAEVEATGAYFESRAVDPMAHLVLAHRLGAALARRRGINPDQPRHLSRSVVLV